MRPPPTRVENYRVKFGPLASDSSYGNNGAFLIPSPLGGLLQCIVSDDSENQYRWEHVSVCWVSDDGARNRIPRWEEMCYAKDLFWSEEECVVQFHPPKSQYVNCHPMVLHLWKRIGAEFETPPKILIAPVMEER